MLGCLQGASLGDKLKLMAVSQKLKMMIVSRFEGLLGCEAKIDDSPMF